MEQTVVNNPQEFSTLVGSLPEFIKQASDNPVAIGATLFYLAQERKNTNIIITNLNEKIDLLIKRVEQMEGRSPTNNTNDKINQLSERDEQVLAFVTKKGNVCSDDLVKKFKYRGKNAASARLSKLFHDGLLEKVYRGRKVYYTQN